MPDKIDVLDYGFVRLVERMGSDLSGKKRRHRREALPRKIAVLVALRDTGEIRAACRRAKVSPSNFTSWRATDPAFADYEAEILAPWRGVDGRRRCRCCDIIKPVTDFAARSDRDGKQRSTCRACYRDQGRRSYARNKVDGFFRHKASRTRSRSASLKVPCNVDAAYLEAIWSDRCPVLGTDLDRHTPRSEENAPELDRIIPRLGYTKGNVVWLSRRANRIKNNVALDEMKKLVSWLEAILEGVQCAA